MKTIETHYGGNWLDRILNAWPLALHKESIKPVVEVEYGANPVSEASPGWRNLVVRTGGRCQTRSLFRNGVVYFRLLWPFGIFLHVRWCGPCRRAFLQSGLGWKLNGRFTITLRVQSDATAAAGTWGPNHGQARGFKEGDH